MPQYPSMKRQFAILFLAGCAVLLPAQKRLVLIDQDGSGPGGSDQMAMLALLQAPDVQVLGITMVTGDAWRDEETLHTLRMLELTGHADVPVARGAVFPLVRTQEETRLQTALDGKVTWLGAWGRGRDKFDRNRNRHAARASRIARALRDSAHARGHAHNKADRRRRRALPHPPGACASAPGDDLRRRAANQYCAGRRASIRSLRALTKGIVVMGGSLNPQTSDPEFATSPRHEFNFWFDPEAAHIVLRADWPRIDVTTVDISIKAPFTQAMLDAIAKSQTPAARYIAAWSQQRYYMWDELEACAWLDPSIITKEQTGLHGCGPEPRSQLRRHAHVAGKSEARNRRAAGSRATRSGFAAFPENICGVDDADAVAGRARAGLFGGGQSRSS